MQRRSLYSLLLTSFILVFAFSYSVAQDVTFESDTAIRGVASTLDVTVNNTADISAFEIVFEVASGSGGAYFDALGVNWDPGLTVLTHRYIDLSDFDGVTPSTVRIAGMMIADGDVCLATGANVVAQLAFTSNNVCEGTIVIDGTTMQITKCNSCVIDAQTQFVDCGTTALVAAAVNAGTVTLTNNIPTVDGIANDVLDWGDVHHSQIVADDGDLVGPFESLSYAKVSGPADLEVNATTGAITWITTGADVGLSTVEVSVTDACGAVVTTTYTICVENTAPVITCPEEVTNIIWGYTATGTVTATDADSGPSSLLYTVAGFDGPGTPTVNGATGEWSWTTLEEPAYVGDFELCLTVTDGANTDACSPENADTCCVYIHVITTGTVVIEKTHNSMQNQFEDVSITMENSTLEIGGFDFLIKYDQTMLTFSGAELGQPLLDCGWEYFEYRQGVNGNCGGNACPTGIVRLVAIAETNNGMAHPTCFNGGDYVKWEMASMRFLVDANLTYECMYAPVRWLWYDCGDNGISSVTGDTLFISRDVFTFEGGVSFWTETPGFPTLDGAPVECDVSDKTFPLRAIDYWHGGVDIICVEDIDDRGDINMNGIVNEVADAVLFTNYFVYGMSVFTVGNPAGQVAATDVNADGITLSVADLVYLVRVIIGDAQPYPKVVTPTQVAIRNQAGALAVNGSEIGAAYVVASGSVHPELTVDGMDMLYNYDGDADVTRILVYSLDGNSFTGSFLNVNGDVVSIEMATREGLPVAMIDLPTDFALNQNYPNPFNPTTNLSFSLPTACDYTLGVYNVAGQRVAEFTGSHAAGEVVLEWNANDMASGIYFYRLDAEGFSATKKMVLLK